MINVKKLRSMDHAIQIAMNRMNLQDDRMRPLLATWGVEADREIGSFYGYERKIHVLPVQNQNEVILPCNVVSVIGVLYGDMGCDCQKVFRMAYQYYSTGAFSSGYFLFQSLTDSSGIVLSPITRFDIRDGKIMFFTPVDLAQVTVEVLQYRVDEKGIPMVDEGHLRAIAQYIELQMALRSKWGASEDKITQAEVDAIDYEWHRLCRLARAEDASPSQTERAEIVSMMNDPLTGMTNSVWRYPDEFYGGFYL